MKKFIGVLLCVLLLTGCYKQQSYTFNVDTGSIVKVTFDTEYDYKFAQDEGSLYITSDAWSISGDWFQGFFYDYIGEQCAEQGQEEENFCGHYVWCFYDTDTDSEACIVSVDEATCLLLETAELNEEQFRDILCHLLIEVQ